MNTTYNHFNRVGGGYFDTKTISFERSPTFISKITNFNQIGSCF